MLHISYFTLHVYVEHVCMVQFINFRVWGGKTAVFVK